ncbi:MAG: ATP-dependent helicase HrpB [Hyphomicrobiaceae bacterium]
MKESSALPVDEALPGLRAALGRGNRAVLVAPPGAGKTTRVPLALMDESWLAGRRIVILEPRRIAARGAAHHMASMCAERVGETVGIRARLSTSVSRRTRIEVVTEGVFTRMILADPMLEGIGAVLIDEFHERSLDADLALALTLDAQAAVREDLRLVVMSATLDGARVAGLLGGAPVVESTGRAFPVETRYLGRDRALRIEDQAVRAVLSALGSEPGSILVFLPGQGEIRRVAERLAERVSDATVDIAPLYGAMDQSAQDLAIRSAAPGRRKVVLATSIAETSITIEGVRVVIDCGLARVPRYEPDVGVTRLETVRVSRAAADQRRGRAGRTEPGVCFRLWDEPQTQSLIAFAEPEIRSADLAGLVLDCAAWGVMDPLCLAWLDPPPAAALDAARVTLRSIGAIDGDGAITALGRQVRDLPLPPRLAAMVVDSARDGAEADAAMIAAVLVERGLGGTSVDLDERLAVFRRDRSRRADDMRRLARSWAEAARAAAATGRRTTHGGAASSDRHPSTSVSDTAALLARAFPDRIARSRGGAQRNHYLLASGRGGIIDEAEAIAGTPFVVVAEQQGTAARTRILLAARLDAERLDEIAHDRITMVDEVEFDTDAGAVRARRVRRLDQIVLASEPRPVTPSAATASALAQGAAERGIARLPWSKAQRQLRDRIGFVRATASDWPDLSDQALAASVATWLAPFLHDRTRLSEIDADVLGVALDTLVPYALRQRLDAEAPTHFEAPTGNRHAIDYESEGAPVLAIRVQELFGLTTHPMIANGRVPLTLHLLSPAHRPLQITRDLVGFWSGSWASVRADMRGRYPKHSWPEDPSRAVPTSRAKPRVK